MIARGILQQTIEKIAHLSNKTALLLENLSDQLSQANVYRNVNYMSLDKNVQLLLGALVNNTLSLTALLNQTVE